jgi:hypothetical protein
MAVHCFRVFSVWLTALMTLVVQTPHVQCRCPNGRLKLFCLSSMFSSRSCCCDGSCCGGPADACCRPVAAPQRRACCCGKQTKTDTRQQASSSGCQKRLAELAKFAPTHVYAAVGTPVVAALVNGSVASPITGAEEGHVSHWLVHGTAPPIDLVITQRHLLI